MIRLPGFLRRVAPHLGVVNLRDYLTGGAGTTGSPWTGHTAAPVAAGTVVLAPAGYYTASATFDLSYPGVSLIGHGATFRYTGSGTALKVYSAQTDNSLIPFRPRLEGFTVDGGANAAQGVLLQACHDVRLNFRVINCARDKVVMQWVVGPTGYLDLRGNVDETTHSQRGLVCDQGTQGSGYGTTAGDLYVHASNCGVAGIDLPYAFFMLLKGYSEINGGIGVRIGAGSWGNRIAVFDCEFNTGGDFDVAGDSNTLADCTSDGVTTVRSGARGNVLAGGRYSGIVVEAGAVGTAIGPLRYGYSGRQAGTLTVRDPSTRVHPATYSDDGGLNTRGTTAPYAGPCSESRSVRDLIRALNPAVYWRMGQRAGLTSITDASGNAQTGTVDTAAGTLTLGSAALTYRDPVTHGAFAGGAYVKRASGSVSGLTGSAAFTVGAFIKTSDATHYQYILARDDQGSGAGPFQRQFAFRVSNTGKAQCFIVIGGTLYTATGSTTVADGLPHFVAATYDGSNLRVWVDGVFDGFVAAAGTMDSPTFQLMAGASNDPINGTLFPFTGTLGEVFVSTTVTASSDHVALIAAAGLAP